MIAYNFGGEAEARRQLLIIKGGFPGGSAVKDSTCQCRRHRSDPCSGKITHAVEWLSHAPQLLSLCSRIWEPQLLSPRAATTEAHDPKSPYSTTREATTTRDQARQPESSPHSPRLEKSPCQATKTQHSQKWNKEIFLKNKYILKKLIF